MRVKGSACASNIPRQYGGVMFSVPVMCEAQQCAAVRARAAGSVCAQVFVVKMPIYVAAPGAAMSSPS